MKNNSPIKIISLGTLIVFLAVFMCGSICSFFLNELALREILLLAIVSSVISFIVFYAIITRYIYRQLRLLFRIIRKGKIAARDELKLSMHDNIIKEATAETESWAAERQKEISRLKEQEAFRREFLGNLAHELKTPVFSIQGYILTLLEGGLEDETVNRKFLERASKATDRMTSILEDLDEITKMEENRFELNASKFDIVSLAQEVMDSFEIPGKEKEIQLVFNKKYDPLYVKADRNRIAQVFTNLISNSISYGKEGGTTTIRFYEIEGALMTEVSDNGPGIKDEDLPRLFERFFRVEQSRNRNEGGSGLGLAIVKHIIETQHNQTINVRSTPDLGSTFSFTLEKAK